MSKNSNGVIKLIKIILAISFLPITIIYLVWAKSNLSKKNKCIVTAVVAVLCMLSMAISNSDKQDDIQTAKEIEVTTTAITTSITTTVPETTTTKTTTTKATTITTTETKTGSLYNSVFYYYYNKLGEKVEIKDFESYVKGQKDNLTTYRSGDKCVEIEIIDNVLNKLSYTDSEKIIILLIDNSEKKYIVGNKNDNQFYTVENFNVLENFMFSDEPIVTIENYVLTESDSTTIPPVITTILETEPPQTFPPITEAPKVVTQSYVLNTSTMKVHKASCRDVDKIAKENYDECDDLQWAFDNGYSPCGHCHP